MGDESITLRNHPTVLVSQAVATAVVLFVILNVIDVVEGLTNTLILVAVAWPP